MREFRLSALDGLEISGAVFEAENEKAAVQIIHGEREHKGRYYEFAAFLAGNGCTAVLTDLRGHGESVNARYFLGHFESFPQLVDDQLKVTDYISQICPGKEIILYGHSFGSVVARLMLKDNDTRFKKLIMTGATPPSQFAPVRAALCSAACSIHHANSVNGYFPSAANNIAGEKLFSNYTALVDYKSDPMVQSCKLTNAAVRCTLQANAELVRIPLHKCANPALRVLSAYGDDDSLTGGLKGLKKTVSALNRDGYSHVFSVFYPTLRHNLLEEGAKEEIFKDIMAFITD